MTYNPYSTLENKEFRFFLGLRLAVTLAIQIEAVVVGWQVYDLTKDAFSLGLIGLAEAIPAICVALYAGHLADVSNRKHIMVVVLSLLLFCGIGLWGLTTFGKALPQGELLLGIYAIIFLTGVARGFLSPTTTAFMGQIVDKSLYKNAVTWSSNVWQTAFVVGSAVAGLLYASIGIEHTYLVQVGLLVVGLFCLLNIASKPIPHYVKGESISTRIGEGLRFVFRNQLLISALSLDLFAVLFGGAVALLPIFAKDILNVGATGLGVLRAMPAVGAVCMALWLAYRPIGKNAGKILLWCVAGFGLATVAFGFSTNF